MKIVIVLVLIAAAVLLGYIRLAPSDPQRWHIALAPRPAILAAPSLQVVTLTGGAYVDVPASTDTLAKLDQIAMATPRTKRLAGSVAEGRITWITRSALFGFPDYTTAQVADGQITLYARLRFGNGDQGVNAARLGLWAAELSQN
jgi:hypothetical protein